MKNYRGDCDSRTAKYSRLNGGLRAPNGMNVRHHPGASPWSSSSYIWRHANSGGDRDNSRELQILGLIRKTGGEFDSKETLIVRFARYPAGSP